MAMTAAERMRRFRERQRALSPDREIKSYDPGSSRDNHGMTDTPEYQSWQNMIRRCYEPTTVRFERYGGRGITVCDRWLTSFRNFYDDMGPSHGFTLDRIDFDKPYEPNNCKWSTYTEQNRNRSDNRYLTHDGRTMLITDWARETGIGLTTIVNRLDRSGWTVERALTERPTQQNPNSPAAIRQRRHREKLKKMATI